MDKLALKTLDVDDVKNVVRHPDASARAIAVQRVCRDIRTKTMSEAERAFAHKLLKHISEDSAEMVRRALAVTLKNSPKLPRDIATKLARDGQSHCCGQAYLRQ